MSKSHELSIEEAVKAMESMSLEEATAFATIAQAIPYTPAETRPKGGGESHPLNKVDVIKPAIPGRVALMDERFEVQEALREARDRELRAKAEPVTLAIDTPEAEIIQHTEPPVLVEGQSAPQATEPPTA